MRILIVEDEKKTSAFLRKGFRNVVFRGGRRGDGGDGLLSARAGNHDLIVLDVMLPESRRMDRLSRNSAHASLHTPVLFLTARDLVRDQVKGLGLGADDYLIKPFAFSELFARIRSILKRGPVRQESTVRIGDLEIDPRLHKALRAGRGQQLTARIHLLAYLSAVLPDVVSRASIAEHVWDINFDTGTNMVEAAIRRRGRKWTTPLKRSSFIRCAASAMFLKRADRSSSAIGSRILGAKSWSITARLAAFTPPTTALLLPGHDVRSLLAGDSPNEWKTGNS